MITMLVLLIPIFAFFVGLYVGHLLPDLEPKQPVPADVRVLELEKQLFFTQAVVEAARKPIAIKRAKRGTVHRDEAFWDAMSELMEAVDEYERARGAEVSVLKERRHARR